MENPSPPANVILSSIKFNPNNLVLGPSRFLRLNDTNNTKYQNFVSRHVDNEILSNYDKSLGICFNENLNILEKITLIGQNNGEHFWKKIIYKGKEKYIHMSK